MRFILFLGLILTGCDLTPFYVAENGEFNATVRGALDLDIHGDASSFLHTDTVPVFFDLHLQRTGVDYAGSIRFEIDRDERTAGTYPIGPDVGQMHVVYDVDSRTEQEFMATAGELVIREVRDDDLLGSFAFEAVDAAGAVATVVGAYRASRIAYPGPE